MHPAILRHYPNMPYCDIVKAERRMNDGSQCHSNGVLKKVANSMVIRRRYANVEDALRELALTAVRDKINHDQRRIRRLERKYNTDFDTFTQQINGRASPMEEDDWLAWRSARSMLADWRQTYRDLLNERPD
jgi:hypothetical protein